MRNPLSPPLHFIPLNICPSITRSHYHHLYYLWPLVTIVTTTRTLHYHHTDTINSLGDKPVREPLAFVGGWPMMGDDLDKDWNLESAIAKLNLLNYGVLINFYVYVDDMNSTVNRIQVSGLSYATLDSYAHTPLDSPSTRPSTHYPITHTHRMP